MREWLKKTARGALRPLAEGLWPAAAEISRLRSHMSRSPRIQWSPVWTPAMDEALNQLPAPAGCTRDQYRELVKPTDTPKRHALALEDGAPTALISLRRRMRFWEPVAYQALPGVIAPAADMAALGRAVRALGVEVRVAAGLGEEVRGMGCGRIDAYDVYQVDLRGDYQAHWHKKNQRHLSTIRRARRRCADLEHRVDGEGDLEWIVEAWRAAWKDEPGEEVNAATDRRRFWSVLAGAPRSRNQWSVHTMQLVAGDRRVAGVVSLCRGDVASFQCWARDAEFDELGAGNRALDLALEWAAADNYACYDLGGGGVKHRWGPAAATRYSFTICPLLIRALYRVAPD